MATVTALEALGVGCAVVGIVEETGEVLVWNGSSTFNWWRVEDTGDWIETDVFTRYGTRGATAENGGGGLPCTYEEALEVGKEAALERGLKSFEVEVRQKREKRWVVEVKARSEREACQIADEAFDAAYGEMSDSVMFDGREVEVDTLEEDDDSDWDYPEVSIKR